MTNIVNSKMSVISPPALVVLTVGSFNNVYNAFFNYPRRPAEIGYFANDIILDTISLGTFCFGIDFLYKSGNHVLAWGLLVPVFIVMLVSMLVLMIRLRAESKVKNYENIPIRRAKLKKHVLKRVKKLLENN